MHLSQEKLLESLQDSNLPHFGRNTLSRLENGDPSAFNAVSMGQWIALCDVFGCSVGHLLGEYDSTTYDLEFIRQKTNLTEKAVTILTDLQYNGIRGFYFPFVISALLEHHNLGYFLALLHSRFTQNDDNNIVEIKLSNDNMPAHIETAGLLDSILSTHFIQDIPSLKEKYQELWNNFTNPMS